MDKSKKEKIEKYLKENKIKYKWLEDGSLMINHNYIAYRKWLIVPYLELQYNAVLDYDIDNFFKTFINSYKPRKKCAYVYCDKEEDVLLKNGCCSEECYKKKKIYDDFSDYMTVESGYSTYNYFCPYCRHIREFDVNTRKHKFKCSNCEKKYYVEFIEGDFDYDFEEYDFSHIHIKPTKEEVERKYLKVIKDE